MKRRLLELLGLLAIILIITLAPIAVGQVWPAVMLIVGLWLALVALLVRDARARRPRRARETWHASASDGVR